MGEVLRDSDGKTVTREKAEADFQKSWIVAGNEVSGPEYDAALTRWMTTYKPVGKAEQRGNRVFIRTLLACLVITAIASVISLPFGGLISFAIVFFVGFLVSVGFAGVVAVVVSIFSKPDAPQQ